MFPLLLAPGLLLIGIALLIVGADWFLDGAGDLAQAMGGGTNAELDIPQ